MRDAQSRIYVRPRRGWAPVLGPGPGLRRPAAKPRALFIGLIPLFVCTREGRVRVGCGTSTTRFEPLPLWAFNAFLDFYRL